MMMQILKAGGLKVVYDKKKPSTNANTNGFYEYGGMESKPEWWVDKNGGDCIKVLAPQVKQLGDRKVKYIFMVRDMREVADSFNRMHRADLWAMGYIRLETEKWLKDKDVVRINYNAVIENPAHELAKIKDLIPNFEEALKVVDKKLYRTKPQEGRAITKDDLEKKKEWLQGEIKQVDKLLEAFKEVYGTKH